MGDLGLIDITIPYSSFSMQVDLEAFLRCQTPAKFKKLLGLIKENPLNMENTMLQIFRWFNHRIDVVEMQKQDIKLEFSTAYTQLCEYRVLAQTGKLPVGIPLSDAEWQHARKQERYYQKKCKSLERDFKACKREEKKLNKWHTVAVSWAKKNGIDR